jgi:hypothetical protein
MLPNLKQVLCMIAQSVSGGNEAVYWMIFLSKSDAMEGGIMMKFTENCVGGSFLDTTFYLGTQEQFN